MRLNGKETTRLVEKRTKEKKTKERKIKLKNKTKPKTLRSKQSLLKSFTFLFQSWRTCGSFAPGVLQDPRCEGGVVKEWTELSALGVEIG